MYKGQTYSFELGMGGLNRDRDLTRIPSTELSVAEHVTFERDTLRKRGGVTAYNTTPAAGSPMIGGFTDFFLLGATQHFPVATGDGKLYDAAGGAISTTYKTGLATGKLTHFLTGYDQGAVGPKDKAFSYDGADVVQVYDGTAVAGLAVPPADWSGSNQPIFGLIHRQKHWAFGNPNRLNFLYFSKTNIWEDFTTGSGLGGQFDIYGLPVTGLAENLKTLFAWTAQKIFFVDTAAVDQTSWRVLPFDASGGTRSPYGILVVPNDIVFMGEDANLYSLSAVQAFGDFAKANLGERWLQNYLRDHVTRSALGGVRSLYDSLTKILYWAIPTDGATTNNVLLKARLPTAARPESSIRWSLDPGITAASLGLRTVAGTLQPYYGDYAGQIQAIGQAAFSDNGVAYAARARSGDSDFGLPHTTKLYQGAEIEQTPLQAGTGVFSWYIDQVYAGSRAFNLLGGGVPLGSFVLGTDHLGDPEATSRQRFPLTGRGQRYKWEVVEDGLGLGWDLVRIKIDYMPQGRPTGKVAV